MKWNFFSAKYTQDSQVKEHEDWVLRWYIDLLRSYQRVHRKRRFQNITKAYSWQWHISVSKHNCHRKVSSFLLLLFSYKARVLQWPETCITKLMRFRSWVVTYTVATRLYASVWVSEEALMQMCALPGV